MILATSRSGMDSQLQKYGICCSSRMIVNECNAERQNLRWTNMIVWKGFDLVSFPEAMTEGVYFYSILKN